MAGALKVYNPNTSSWEVVDYGPGMRTYSGADYTAVTGTLNNATWQQISIDSSLKDTDSYNTGADEYFTVPTDGFYVITFSSALAYTGGASEFVNIIGPSSMVNDGTCWAKSSLTMKAGTWNRLSTTAVKWLAEGTQVKFMAWQGSGAGQTLDGFMSIARLNGQKGDTGPAGPAGPTGPTGGGALVINDLNDVNTTGLADNNILRYNLANLAWEPEALKEAITDLTDVNDAGITDGQGLKWNVATGKYIPVDIGDAGLTMSDIWPVGSIYIGVTSTNPGTLLGMGTWVAFGEGRVLVGRNGADTDFDTAEETGGSKTASHTHSYSTVIAHSHGINDPSHAHGVADAGHFHVEMSTSGGGPASWQVQRTTAAGAQNTTNTTAAATTGIGIYGAYTGISTQSAGSGSGSTAATAPSVVQPYIVVYMWKRTV